MAGRVRRVREAHETVAWRFPAKARDECLALIDGLQGTLGVKGRSEVLERLVSIAAHNPKQVARLNEKTPWPVELKG